MTEKVCQLYEEEQLGKTREGRKAVPANKMPELGWDMAETLEIKENRQKTNNIPLALQTIVTIIIIISVIVRLSTTQLGKLAMFLKEAAITTLRVSRNVYRQNMERFHNTTIAAITIATSTTNWIDRDEMNPNSDRNSHISVNSRKPNDEHDYSYRSHPQRGAVPTATSTTNCTQFPSSLRKDRINNGNSRTQTVNRTATNNNEVLTVV